MLDLPDEDMPLRRMIVPGGAYTLRLLLQKAMYSYRCKRDIDQIRCLLTVFQAIRNYTQGQCLYLGHCFFLYMPVGERFTQRR